MEYRHGLAMGVFGQCLMACDEWESRTIQSLRF
jgi:hypothetical protein